MEYFSAAVNSIETRSLDEWDSSHLTMKVRVTVPSAVGLISSSEFVVDSVKLFGSNATTEKGL